MKLDVEITRDDYMQFNVDHFFRKRFKKILIGICAFLALVLGLAVLTTGITKSLFTDFIMPLMIIVAVYIAVFRFFLIRTKKIPDDNGSLLGMKKFEVREDGITYSNATMNGFYAWNAVRSFMESKHAFYIYLDRNMAFIFPKRCFANLNQQDTFRETVTGQTMNQH